MCKAIRLILDNDVILTRVAKQVFEAVDIDKSGYIDRSELALMLKNIAAETANEPPTEENIKHVMDAVDESSDGRVSYDEFKVMIREILTIILDAH